MIASKVFEKRLKNELRATRQNEERARHDLKKVLLDKSDDAAAERLKRHELEDKLRELEFQQLLSSNSVLPHSIDDGLEVPLSDYTLLTNAVLHLISEEPVDTSVYKIIINQLIRKLGNDKQID